MVSHNARFILRKQFAAIQQYPGGKVKVFYHPAKPQKSYLIVAGKMGILLTLFISALPLPLFYFKYYA
ncbi:hypothetical protein [Neptunicella sp. SCSIO 80796]|uniref:DUF3592 domain-containing protein n=1 Tax=Neptunicella plasticusilytica TaxID=3117012 RepID=UPI003A4D46C2